MDETQLPKGPLAAIDHEGKVRTPWDLGERTGIFALLALVPTILVFDYVSGRDFSLHLFYLVPTGLAAWNFGMRAGIAVALVAGTYWAWIGFALHHPQAGVLALAWDVVSTVTLFLFLAFVVGRHRMLHATLVETARLDLASGALSRREFSRLFDTEVRRSRRYKRPLALVLFDAASERDFKLRGREFLPAVVRAAQQDIRGSDAVGRLGERRLAILLVECAPEEAMHVAGRIRGRLGANLKIEPPPVGVLSYGGAGPLGAPELIDAVTEQLARAQAGTGLCENRIP